MKSVNTALVALAALFWGLSGGIGGILTTQGWDPVVVSFYRGAIGFFFVLVWLALRPRDSGLASHRLWFWSTIAGVGVAGNFAFYFVSIAEGSVAVAATLMYCAPVFVYLVSFTLKLEKPTLFKWIAIVLVIVGVVLLTGIHEIGAGDVTPIAASAGLLSGLSYAVFIFGFKYAAPHGSPQAILVIAFAVLAAILFWLGDADQTVAILSTPSWPLFVVLGVFGAGLSFIFYIIGLNHTAPAVAELTRFMQEYPERNVLIEGYTDSIGSDEYNLQLSRQRASSVQDALIERGISRNRIRTTGYGKQFPVATNETESGRQQNRRVEVIISDRDGVIQDREN